MFCTLPPFPHPPLPPPALLDTSTLHRCDGVYDSPVLDDVMMWKDQVLLRWIALLLHGSNNNGTSTATIEKAFESSSLKEGAFAGGGTGDAAYGWAQRLGLAVHEAFCSARIAELFDIIADYPDSAVAIRELKVEKGGGGGEKRTKLVICCCWWWYRWLIVLAVSSVGDYILGCY